MDFHSVLRCLNLDHWQQDHFPVRPGSKFEGFYSRILLETGETLVLVFCWVTGATNRPQLVHISHHPPSGLSHLQSFTYELFPNTFHTSLRPTHSRVHGLQSFSIRAEGIGEMAVTPDILEYRIAYDDLKVTLKLAGHTPWLPRKPFSGPMGYIANLWNLLPLCWHVRSISSHAEYDISHAGRQLSGTGIAHVEKNWGVSFPRGWIWCQAFPSASSEGRSICLAGGTALPGVHAYLIGYRSPKVNWDFRPPYSMAIGPISPFLSVQIDSQHGTIRLATWTLKRKLCINITAPPDSFFSISVPFKYGHQLGYAFESFQAKVWIQAWYRMWPWDEYTCIDEGYCGASLDGSGCAALEFGGSFCHLSRRGEGE